MFFRIKHFLKFNMSNIQRINHFTNYKKCCIKVIEDHDKKTANVIMQRMPVNSFNLELLEELTKTIKDLERKNYRGVILSSSSPTVFSAGLDLTELVMPDKLRLQKFWKALQNMWKTLYLTPLITIAAVNGHAPAGGCLLALCCDHRIMVKGRFTIGLPAVKLGFPCPMWLCKMFIDAMGYYRAEHAIMLGELFSPEEALKLNIVNELVDSSAELLPLANAQMDKWLKIPITSFRMTKLGVRQPQVDEMVSYEQKELDDIIHVILQEETQMVMKNYFENVTGKYKKSSI